MIWYLLYPFRGTTEPPILAANHPLRRAFYRYGFTAARHWLAFILLSVGIAVLLCYPVFFLYENPTTGFSKLPLHVWTSARLYDGSQSAQPDIVIRQVWVHGNHMGALEKNVLLEALRIQNILVPNTPKPVLGIEGSKDAEVHSLDSENLCPTDGAHFQYWGFHSPLMFWNCSSATIRKDTDVLGTIYSQASHRSYLNLTLQPTSVFAGKAFDKNRVQAADALVITLFDKRKDEVEELWEEAFDRLAVDASKSGNLLYPRGGHVTQSHLYEFQQKPLSSRDFFFLFGSYSLMGLYVIVILGKLRAVKSWAGLIVAVMFEIALSITASFSICGLLKIDLARIPDAAYPFVVLVMGLENMFRLINAVLSQKPEMHTAQRIATALSEVGHLSLATAAQMLLVLWFLAKVASGVTAFCVFAAIALVFDYAFHLTFFVAVLSVDVRRMELQDSLDRTKSAPPTRRQSTGHQERRYWLDALLQGRLPFVSRIAGSAISIVFILALNMHFYDSGNFVWSLAQSLKSMFYSQAGRYNPPFIAPPINQARTPAAWLRIQDYRYAQEVLGYVKPTAHSIIARVYDPVVVVLKNSNRSGKPLRELSFLALFWSLIRKHIYPFLLAIIFSVAFVTLLMQYLLWNELPDEDADDEGPNSFILTLDSLPKSHRLDVIQLAASGKGHLVSVSLDRLITFSLYDSRTHMYSLSSALATAMTPPLWPVVALAIDDHGNWVALCGPTGAVVFWNMAERKPSHTANIVLNEQHPILFSLATIGGAESEHLVLIVAMPDGRATVVDPFQSGVTQDFVISREKLSFANVSRTRSVSTFIALTKSGKVRVATEETGQWTVSMLEKLDPRLAPSSAEGIIKSISILPTLGVMAAIRLRVVDLVCLKTKTMIHSFPAILVRGQSLRIVSSPARQCKICNAPAVHSLSLAYIDFESHSLVLRTYNLSNDYNDLICLTSRLSGKNYTCRGLSSAKEHVYTVESPGSWEATNVQALIGLRTRHSGADTPHSTMSSTSGFEAQQFTMQAFDSIKKRSQADGTSRFSALLNLDKTYDHSQPSADDWEVWTLSANGDFHTEPLHSLGAQERAQSIGEDELLVAAPGPIVRLGQKSVAMGFGNRVKVAMVGTERFEQDAGEFQDLAHPGNPRRKKPPGKRGI